MMSEGFRNVPGVPDGWELVAIRKARYMENYIWTSGYPSLWQDSEESDFVSPIIRKIEKPAKYRRFTNGADFMANKGQGIAVDWSSPSDCPGFYAIVSANNSFLWVAFGDVIQRFEWEQAFDKLKFRHADNSTSPFGVRIDES
jgi:hypothetical protein